MKINLEQAIDMLPAVGAIYEKLDLKTYAIENQKGKNTEELGLDMIFSHVLKNIKKIKPEILEIVGIAIEKDIEEVKKESVFTLINIVKEMLTDLELVNFFKQAV